MIERVVVAAAAGAVSGAVGRGAFDPESDMVGGVREGDAGFGDEIHDSSSSEEDIRLVGGGGVLGCWNNTLGC